MNEIIIFQIKAQQIGVGYYNSKSIGFVTNGNWNVKGSDAKKIKAFFNCKCEK
ncbi:MAG: hypothetical protein ABWZ66_09105 [Pyrinomonadaceae bacterium]